jgi:hypothetical protein
MTSKTMYIIESFVFLAAVVGSPVRGDTADAVEKPLGARLAGVIQVAGEPFEAETLEPEDVPEDGPPSEGWFHFRIYDVRAAIPGPGVELKVRSDRSPHCGVISAATKQASVMMYVAPDYESIPELELKAMTSLRDALAEELVEGGMGVSEALQAIRKAVRSLQGLTDRKLFEAVISASTLDLRQETELHKALRTAILIHLRGQIPTATRAVRHDMVRYLTYVLWDLKGRGCVAYTFAYGGNMVCRAAFSVFKKDRISDLAPVFATTVDPEPLLRKHYPELFAGERNTRSDGLPVLDGFPGGESEFGPGEPDEEVPRK